jgi:DNA-binding response OmpR family regulator
MAHTQQALIVARNGNVGNALIQSLSASGFDIVLVTTFEAARRQLQARPDLLVTELKLGEYNGLHIALRARAEGIPAIVLGPADPVLAQDAVAIGATYLPALPRHEDFLKTVHEIVERDEDRARVSTFDLALWAIPAGPGGHARALIN